MQARSMTETAGYNEQVREGRTADMESVAQGNERRRSQMQIVCQNALRWCTKWDEKQKENKRCIARL